MLRSSWLWPYSPAGWSWRLTSEPTTVMSVALMALAIPWALSPGIFAIGLLTALVPGPLAWPFAWLELMGGAIVLRIAVRAVLCWLGVEIVLRDRRAR